MRQNRQQRTGYRCSSVGILNRYVIYISSSSPDEQHQSDRDIELHERHQNPRPTCIAFASLQVISQSFQH